VGATNNIYIPLIARKRAEEILLEGVDVEGSPLQWIFSAIKSDSFRWPGLTSKDSGKTWYLEQEMYGRRRKTSLKSYYKMNNVLVGILMGSDSDWPVVKAAADALKDFGIASEAKVISAHRTPRDLEQYVRTARERGIRVLICAAGGAAHLP